MLFARSDGPALATGPDFSPAGTVLARAPGFSRPASSGSVQRADLAWPEFVDYIYRLGGTDFLPMGAAMMMDTGEPALAGGTAAGTKPVAEAFGRQMVLATGSAAAEAAQTYRQWAKFVGIYTGRVHGGVSRKFNMPGAGAAGSVASTTEATPTNGFTYIGSTSIPCVDPINLGRSYIGPGDVGVVRRMGPVMGWGSNTGLATAAFDVVGMVSETAPKDGVVSQAGLLTTTTNSRPFGIGITIDALGAYQTSGSGMGARLWLHP